MRGFIVHESAFCKLSHIQSFPETRIRYEVRKEPLCMIMHLYYDHTLDSFPLYTFLWPEYGPQWPKHVVVSIINKIQDSCVLTYPPPQLTVESFSGGMW